MLIISPAQCRAARALLNWSQPVAEAQLIQFNIFWDQAIIPPEKK